MAQWNGMYSGNTHETFVQDLELALRQAVDSFRLAVTESELRAKARAVRSLAKRLLSVRRRLLKAKLVAAQRVRAAEATEPRERQIASLRQRHAELSEQGLENILAEFGAQDAVTV